MIDPLKLALAQHFVQLKRGSPQLYALIGNALRDCSDPEMKGLLAVPNDQLPGQQGRARMITELLEVYFRCEEMLAPPPGPKAAFKPSDTTFGDLMNGR